MAILTYCVKLEKAKCLKFIKQDLHLVHVILKGNNSTERGDHSMKVNRIRNVVYMSYCNY